MQSIEKMIRDRYQILVERSSVLSDDFPYRFFEPEHDGTEHIEYDPSGTFSLVSTERGEEYGREETRDFDEFMYMIFRRRAEGYGRGYAFRNLNPERNFRKTYFSKALEVMSEISSEWRDQLSQHFDRILAEHPYEDK